MVDVIKQVKPKLLTLQTPCVSLRTLVWLQKQSHSSWKKWDAIVTSLNDYDHWHKKSKIVGILLTSCHAPSFYERLYAMSSRVSVILVSRSVLSTKSEAYWVDNFDNLLCLDDMHEVYPYIGHPWDQSIEDGIGLFAHVARYHRMVDCVLPVSRITTFQGNLTLEHDITPPAIWLVTQYFRHSDEARATEIIECLRRNTECADISSIRLLTERDYSHDWRSFQSPKINQIVIQKRLTYAHFLQYVKERVPKNTIVILANADIFFEDLSDVWRTPLKNAMLALLRWDVTLDSDPELFGPRADSQDSWIVLSDSIKDSKWTYEPFDIQLGQPGCDNIFAGRMLQNHFVLYNPSLTIKSYHLHLTKIRNYTPEDALRATLYVNLVPSHIIDTKQEKQLEKIDTLSNETVAFEIKSNSISNEITYCTMLEHYKWEPSVENYYFDEISLYRWRNACVTPNGLVYTPYTIYPGDDERYPYWNGSTVGIFTSLESVDQMIALPSADLSVFDKNHYYLYYARVLRLLEKYPSASFWCPRGFHSTKGNPLLLGDHACYAKEVIGFVPGAIETSREEILLLRNEYIREPTPTSKRCVVIGDYSKKQLSEILYKEWYIECSTDPSIELLQGCALCIILPNAHPSVSSLLWALPSTAYLIEFQQELSITGECQHMAHVCELKSWVILVSKGSVEKQIMAELGRWMIQHDDEIKNIV
jgi:hypothetical protein